jgi:hypothetical protein
LSVEQRASAAGATLAAVPLGDGAQLAAGLAL